ncbi:MAG: hypothetical protein JJ938_15290 [Roseicyclus sp.]|nr:hypothetical protein [Roseicyclus sp.]MBO6626243.1 hypothetical protein [Roseicyclus sp.]MBO6923563.1 hypothetical protein [Roseicyclus sp.]
MIRAAVSLTVWLFGAGLAWGQAAAVQSGEHDGYTRLVLPIGSERDWDVGGEGEIRRITFTPDVPVLDLSRVFDRASRNRLAYIALADELTLSLACDCELRLFRYRDRFLVVDIVDAEPGPPAGTEDPALTDTSTGTGAELPILPNPFGARQMTLDIAQDAASPLRTGPEQDRQLDQAANLLAEQLARASSAGLLEVAPMQPLSAADPTPSIGTEPGEPAPADDHVATEEGSHPTVEDEQTAAAAEPGLALRAETAFDLSRHARDDPVPIERPLSCAPGSELDISSWASGTGFEQEIGWLRARLYDERDQLVPEAAVDLAQYYIYHGFGAEAVFWLGQVQDAPPALMSMALYLTDAEGPVFSEIETTAACSSTEILWRYLDNPDGPAPGEEETRLLLRAFASLPRGLRDILGPRLVRKFLADDRTASAQEVRNALLRGDRLSDTEQFLVDMDVAQTPDPETTRVNLEEVMRSDTRNAPEAMRRYLALHREDGSVVGPERLTVADALLRETGGRPEPGTLWHETLLAHAAAGNLGRALELAALATDPDIEQGILSDLFAQHAANADLAGLVLLATARADQWDQDRATAPLRQEIARRFLEAGLQELAFRVAPPGVPIDPPETVPTDTPAESGLASAWRRGDWSAVAGMPAGPHAEFAGLVATLPADGTPAPSIQDLTVVSRTVSDSAATRALVETILNSPPTISVPD